MAFKKPKSYRPKPEFSSRELEDWHDPEALERVGMTPKPKLGGRTNEEFMKARRDKIAEELERDTKKAEPDHGDAPDVDAPDPIPEAVEEPVEEAVEEADEMRLEIESLKEAMEANNESIMILLKASTAQDKRMEQMREEFAAAINEVHGVALGGLALAEDLEKRINEQSGSDSPGVTADLVTQAESAQHTDTPLTRIEETEEDKSFIPEFGEETIHIGPGRWDRNAISILFDGDDIPKSDWTTVFAKLDNWAYPTRVTLVVDPTDATTLDHRMILERHVEYGIDNIRWVQSTDIVDWLTRSYHAARLYHSGVFKPVDIRWAPPNLEYRWRNLTTIRGCLIINDWSAWETIMTFEACPTPST